MNNHHNNFIEKQVRSEDEGSHYPWQMLFRTYYEPRSALALTTNGTYIRLLLNGGIAQDFIHFNVNLRVIAGILSKVSTRSMTQLQ